MQVRDAGRKIADRTGMKVEACIRDVANALVIRLDRLTDEQREAEPAPVTQSGKNALVAVNAINALMKKLYPTAKPGAARSIGTSASATGAAEGISLHRQTTGNTTKRLT